MNCDMNSIYSLLVVSIIAGFITSIITFFLHRGSWHKNIKKNPINFFNLFVTNIYQFNGTFLGVVSLSVSIAACIIIGNTLFIIFYCDSLIFAFCDVAKIFLAIVALRTVVLLVGYSFFYKENLIQD